MHLLIWRSNMLNYLKKLIGIQSVSGREGRISEYIKGEIGEYFDECYTDALGNLICHKKGEGEKIMFCAHMDEIGFIVTTVDDGGFVHFAPVGGINFTAAAFSEVVFESGLRGILVPEAGAKDDLKAEKFAVDIGAKNKKEAEKLVKCGDTFAVAPKYMRLRGGNICGRPFDDKIACAILMSAAKNSADFKGDVYFVFSVQEEVGLRGSRVAAFAIAPDVGIALDVTATGDGYKAKPMEVSLGGGAAIKIKDSSVICDAKLVERMRDTAEREDIKYQLEVLTAGGTDTASMQLAGAGCKAGCISIPTRYIHSAVETVRISDAEAAEKLVVALCTGK